MQIRLKRVYDPPSKQDGQRVLVDRLWPRGLKKQDADIDHWLKEIAPSTELRKWFDHDPAKWDTFRKRYRRELQDNPRAFEQLKSLADQGRITLLYAARDSKHNQAVILKEALMEGPAARGDSGNPSSPVCYADDFPEYNRLPRKK